MKNTFLSIIGLLIFSQISSAQTSHEILNASKSIELASKDISNFKNDPDRDWISFNKNLAHSLSLTLSVLANYRKEQEGNLSDSYLKSCKMISNQTQTLVLTNALTRSSMKKDSESYRYLNDIGKEYVSIYKLLSPSIIEYERRKLKLD